MFLFSLRSRSLLLLSSSLSAPSPFGATTRAFFRLRWHYRSSLELCRRVRQHQNGRQPARCTPCLLLVSPSPSVLLALSTAAVHCTLQCAAPLYSLPFFVRHIDSAEPFRHTHSPPSPPPPLPSHLPPDGDAAQPHGQRRLHQRARQAPPALGLADSPRDKPRQRSPAPGRASVAGAAACRKVCRVGGRLAGPARQPDVYHRQCR